MIEFKQIGKRFGNFEANKDITFQVQAGSCHGIVGENGAGKSTLMNILYGLYQPDSGALFFRGSPVNFNSPKQAIDKGVGMVHQHFKLVPSLTVWENIILGSEPSRYFLNPQKILNALDALQQQYGFQLELNASVSQLSLGQKQQVELLKLLYRKADILILDEPTALLSRLETDFLFQQLESLRRQGKTILLITHKLDDVIKHTQFVSVLRKGHHCGTFPTSTQTVETLSRLMMGKDRDILKSKRSPSSSLAFSFSLHETILSIHQSEIMGVAGMEGQGQEALIDAVLSAVSIQHGSLYRARQAGFAFIPSDRQEEGLLLPFSTGTNLIFGHHREAIYQKHFQLTPQSYYPHVSPLLTRFQVDPPEVEKQTRTLSGGNQQKVIIARETHGSPSFLLASQPTRGIDRGAMDFIHQHFFNLAERGTGILLLSTDLDEILTLSDRIAVIRDQKIVEVRNKCDFSSEELGLWMSGARS